MLLNKETLFGAHIRDKQWPAGGCRDLPGTKAESAEGCDRSGIRKRAVGGSRQGPGGPRNSGAEQVGAGGSRGSAVTWTAEPGVLRACAMPGSGRGAGAGVRLPAFGWVLLPLGKLVRQAGTPEPASSALPSSLPAERLVLCLSLAACLAPHSSPRLCPGPPEPLRSQVARVPLWQWPLTVIFGRLSWEQNSAQSINPFLSQCLAVTAKIIQIILNLRIGRHTFKD